MQSFYSEMSLSELRALAVLYNIPSAGTLTRTSALQAIIRLDNEKLAMMPAMAAEDRLKGWFIYLFILVRMLIWL